MVGNSFVKAHIFCKEQGILAGLPFVDAVCEELGIKKPAWNYQEGAYLLNASPTNRVTVGTLVGSAKRVLQAERIMLNVLARCSGVATESHRIRSALAWNGWSGQVVGTRKTTPGFRMVEKYGLVVGGAGTHRYDMSSMVMLKDNHVRLAGTTVSMAELITKVSQLKKGHICVWKVTSNHLFVADQKVRRLHIQDRGGVRQSRRGNGRRSGRRRRGHAGQL